MKCTDEDIKDYNIIIITVDNIESRMHINYLVRYINKNIIVLDLGVERMEGHIKILNNNISCLYCIKSLYKIEKSYNLCLLKTLDYKSVKREDFLAMEISKNKKECKEIDCDCYLKKTMNLYNKLEDVDETSIFELKGINNNIIANASYINSIIASLGIIKLFKFIKDDKIDDFTYYNGNTITITSIKIEKDKDCFLCYK